MQKRHEYIWCLIELSNGNKEWYCLSKVLRRALFIEKKHNQFWKKTMIGNYITVARSKYIRGRARLTVGRIEKIRIRKNGAADWHWSRNQFVTAEHLLDLKDSFNYLKHDYCWYNRLAIKVALIYWHNKLLQAELNSKRYGIKKKRLKFERKIK